MEKYLIPLYTLVGALVYLGTCIAALFYGVRIGKTKAVDDRIKPFREAAEGWETLARQTKEEVVGLELKIKTLELKIEAGKGREELIQKQREELKNDLVFAARSNFKLQGEVEKLSERVSILETSRIERT